MTGAKDSMRVLALASLVSLICETAVAQRADRASIGIEVNGHVRGSAARIDGDTQSVALSNMGPMAHETALSFGIGIPDVAGELVLRIGYGFASGSLPAGSIIGGAETTGYSLSAVPVTMGWRTITAPWLVRFLVGVDLGGQVARMSFDSPDRAQLGGGRSWCFGGRAVAGVHVDVWEFIGVRLYAEGRLSQELAVKEGPDVGLNLFGFGLAVVAAPEQLARASLGAPVDTSAAADRDGEPMLDDADSALSRAAAIIREADEAKARRDFIAAEELYRRGVPLLPRDPDTRRNLEVPVRVDWAKVLVEVGRSRDAREVLREAQKIKPDDRDVRALLEELGGSRLAEPADPILDPTPPVAPHE